MFSAISTPTFSKSRSSRIITPSSAPRSEMRRHHSKTFSEASSKHKLQISGLSENSANQMLPLQTPTLSAARSQAYDSPFGSMRNIFSPRTGKKPDPFQDLYGQALSSSSAQHYLRNTIKYLMLAQSLEEAVINTMAASTKMEREQLQRAFSRSSKNAAKCPDNVVAALLKIFLNKLPYPLLIDSQIENFDKLIEISEAYESLKSNQATPEVLVSIKRVFDTLPASNRDAIKQLLHMFHHLHSQDVFCADKASRVFAASLLSRKRGSLMSNRIDLERLNTETFLVFRLVRLLILNASYFEENIGREEQTLEHFLDEHGNGLVLNNFVGQPANAHANSESHSGLQISAPKPLRVLRHPQTSPRKAINPQHRSSTKEKGRSLSAQKQLIASGTQAPTSTVTPLAKARPTRPLPTISDSPQKLASPKKMPLSASPKKMPLSASPKKMPLSASPKKMPLSASPKKMPLSASPKKMPLSASPKKMPLSASPPKMPLGLPQPADFQSPLMASQRNHNPRRSLSPRHSLSPSRGPRKMAPRHSLSPQKNCAPPRFTHKALSPNQKFSPNQAFSPNRNSSPSKAGSSPHRKIKLRNGSHRKPFKSPKPVHRRTLGPIASPEIKPHSPIHLIESNQTLSEVLEIKSAQQLHEMLNDKVSKAQATEQSREDGPLSLEEKKEGNSESLADMDRQAYGLERPFVNNQKSDYAEQFYAKYFQATRPIMWVSRKDSKRIAPWKQIFEIHDIHDMTFDTALRVAQKSRVLAVLTKGSKNNWIFRLEQESVNLTQLRNKMQSALVHNNALRGPFVVFPNRLVLCGFNKELWTYYLCSPKTFSN